MSDKIEILNPENQGSADNNKLYQALNVEIFMSPGVTQKDAAKYLNVSTKTIQRRIAQGIIKTDKNGRIPKEELLRYKEEL